MPVFKNDVKLDHPYPREVWYAIGVFDAMLRYELGVQAVITSLNDGNHMKGSKHYANLAIDERTRQLSPDQAQRIFLTVKAILDPQGYDTVWEGTGEPGSSGQHIHIEFDPKPGETFERRTD